MTNEQINALVAERIFLEPMPPKPNVERKYLILHLSGHPYTSENHNWTVATIFDEGDIPRWIANQFCEDFAETERVLNWITKEKKKVISIHAEAKGGVIELSSTGAVIEETYVYNDGDLKKSLCMLALYLTGYNEEASI